MRHSQVRWAHKVAAVPTEHQANLSQCQCKVNLKQCLCSKVSLKQCLFNQDKALDITNHVISNNNADMFLMRRIPSQTALCLKKKNVPIWAMVPLQHNTKEVIGATEATTDKDVRVHLANHQVLHNKYGVAQQPLGFSIREVVFFEKTI
jgi:hypothetical protein